MLILCDIATHSIANCDISYESVHNLRFSKFF
ncbi:hypothetical protein T4C_7965 [Trichinella pseudospiralis]|uniref:Uncharacterized protein n=1 Tax=Trichinella pseudospiralis TaxID=6337 RepID=A0A0V1GMI2_TRIPS|nr:hypothetical protein T4C_7965 [Trichinella pseudospiralis]